MWFWIIPLTVGAVTVLQGTLNRQMSESMGLGAALVLNSIIVLALSGVLYAIARFRSAWLPDMFADQFQLGQLTWWMVLPGIFGFCVITGIPWAISRLGAAKVFVGIVVAQVVVSMLWDIFITGKPLTMMRVMGAVLAVAGVVLISMDKD